MDKITIRRVTPDIFAGSELNSEVWNQEIEFHKGQRYLINAESGRGKSSLCSYILGYRNDYQGKILFDGEDIRSFDIGHFHTLRQNSISYLPQGLMLFDELSARENIEIKNELTGYRSSEWIDNALVTFMLEDRADFPVSKLSFGQKQRVAIIRALCSRTDFMVLDEPISHLDDNTAHIVSEFLDRELLASGAGLIALSIGKEFQFKYSSTINL